MLILQTVLPRSPRTTDRALSRRGQAAAFRVSGRFGRMSRLNS